MAYQENLLRNNQNKMLEEMTFSYASVVQIIVLVGSLIGFYYKMRLDIARLQSKTNTDIGKLFTKIAEIDRDREQRWDDYKENCEKSEAYMDEVFKTLTDIKVSLSDTNGDIKAIKAHIEHIPK